jgi:putative peptidoglycan lipid II flippase
MATIFFRGEITAYDISKMTLSLQAYGAGLLAFMLIKVLAPGYYARQDTKTPVKIGIQAMIVNMVLNLILIFPFAHMGLALATTVSAYLNAFLLYWGLRKQGLYKAQPGWWSWVFKLLTANVVMLVSIIWLNPEIEQWMAFTEWQRASWTAILVSVGIISYGGILLISGIRLRHLRVNSL